MTDLESTLGRRIDALLATIEAQEREIKRLRGALEEVITLNPKPRRMWETAVAALATDEMGDG